MRASYLFQIINLIVSAALLFLVLGKLSHAMYLQWVLFTTIAGALIQLEGSISVIVTRHISRQIIRNGRSGQRRGLAAAAHLYHRFATVGGALMLCAGGAYLATASHGRFSQAWPLEWVLFCLAYFLYYFFGNFACFLIATQEINFYSQVGIFTRILNLALALLLLFGGFGISGLVISVLISFASGALLYRRKVQKIIADADEVESGDAHDHAHIRLHHVGMHALYILGTYGAYRIGLMVDASGGGDTAHQASYGLALQIFALINILSAVPLTMRVTPLVRAAESGRQEVLLPEIGRLGVLVNAVFLTSAGGFAVASWAVPQVFPTITASMPDTAEVIMLSAAFWVEINILILVNVLLAVQDFRFCWNYFRTLAISLSIGVGSWMLGAPFVISFILIPLIGQAAIGFPTLMHLVRSRFGFGFRSYVRAASDGAIILARALGQIALRE